MFDTLTEAERIALTLKLASATRQFLNEWEALKTAPPLVVRFYCGPGGKAADWLEAGVDCAEAASELMEPVGAGWTA